MKIMARAAMFPPKKALEDENAELKKLLAKTMLDIAILKDVA